MNLLYTIDNNYVPQLAAGINAVCESCKDCGPLYFYVFSNGVSDSNQKKLSSFTEGKGAQIAFIDIRGFMSRVDQSFCTMGWNEIVLSRLLMGSYLPESVNRIVYLDADTIVRRSLSELWNADMGDNTILASMEPICNKKSLERLGLSGKPYYNAGVLLVDLRRWRERGVEERLITCCRTQKDLLYANDQDAINLVLQDEVGAISSSYNVANYYEYYPFSMLSKLMPAYCDYEGYQDAIFNPHIVHFMGEDRPWRLGCTCKYKQDYLDNLAQTPWRNSPQEEGWVRYFQVWAVFNWALRPFPMLRYYIMTAMVPIVMSLRASARK